ncbi:hypothetical protein D3C72_2487380 [compost metagenome]
MGGCIFGRNDPGAGAAQNYSASGGARVRSTFIEFVYQSRKGHLACGQHYLCGNVQNSTTDYGNNLRTAAALL